jgi:Lon-like ATP-dependent protease
VSWYSEVFDLVFPDIDAELANNIWKEQLAEPPSAEKDKAEEHDD